jgi:WD40 repeat protein
MTIKVWDLGSFPKNFRGHTGPIDSVVFSSDDKTLLSVAKKPGQPGEIRRWNVADGQAKGSLPLRFSAVAINSDGKTLAVGSDDGTIQLLDAISGGKQHTLKGHTAAVLAVAFSADGQTLASVARPFQRPGEIRRWDVAGGTAKESFPVKMGDGTFVAFSNDGKTLATGRGEKTIKTLTRWDVATGQEKHTLDGAPLIALAFSGDGKTLAWVGDNGTIKLWDVESGREKHALKVQAGAKVSAVAFSDDGQTLATGHGDGTITLLDVTTGQAKVSFWAHLTGVTAVAFRGDGRALVAGSGDGSIKLWDLRGVR